MGLFLNLTLLRITEMTNMLRRDFIMTAIASAVASIFPVRQQSFENVEDVLSRIREKKINLNYFGVYESFRYIRSPNLNPKADY